MPHDGIVGLGLKGLSVDPLSNLLDRLLQSSEVMILRALPPPSSGSQLTTLRTGTGKWPSCRSVLATPPSTTAATAATVSLTRAARALACRHPACRSSKGLLRPLQGRARLAKGPT